jgi:hypothetical protein
VNDRTMASLWVCEETRKEMKTRMIRKSSVLLISKAWGIGSEKKKGMGEEVTVGKGSKIKRKKGNR